MSLKIWLIIALLALVNLTHILDFMIMMPLGNYLVPTLDINEKQFTILISSYAFSAGVSSFISAFFVNQFDRKQVLILAYAGFLIGTICCGYAEDYTFLLSARIVAGIFGGLIGAQVIAIISDLVPFEKRGMAVGMIMSAFALASTLGVPFSLKLANSYDWHAPFKFVFGMGCFVFVALFFGIPSMVKYKQSKSTNKLEVLWQIVRVKRQYLALIFSFSMFFGHFVIIPFINPFLEFNMGFSKLQTPELYFYGGMAAFVSSFFMGYVSDKIGKFTTFIICTLLSLPLVILVTHLPVMAWERVLVIFALWFMFSTGRSITSQSLISNVSEPQFRGSFQSFNSFVQQIGSGGAALVAGIIVSQDPKTYRLYHYDWLGYFSILILVLGIVLGYVVFGKDEWSKKTTV
jgi:MFS transporter, DHA1 family, inner membrane transport protein